MADTSEEKSQPATDKKLKDARKKGQVAKSQDLTSGMVILFCTLCISIVAPKAEAQVPALIYIEPFSTAWPRVLGTAEQLLLNITLPVMAVTLGSVILTNLVTMKGVVFSGHPIKPDFKRINPAEGFKRIFAMRNFVEFIKGLVKVFLRSEEH